MGCYPALLFLGSGFVIHSMETILQLKAKIYGLIKHVPFLFVVFSLLLVFVPKMIVVVFAIKSIVWLIVFGCIIIFR